MLIIPPIKSQGIKTKLVPWIINTMQRSGINLEKAVWIEPFFGTGVVGFNIPILRSHIVGDTNPHIIDFYNAIQIEEITESTMRSYLEREGRLLAMADDNGYEHYREIRSRFNQEQNPFDFLFLSRAGFNGMMRFNKLGQWNIPFCKKPQRFAPAYVTKICNQIKATSTVIKSGQWEFCTQDFSQTIARAQKGDIIYCDPPYFGRYADYYNGWTEKDEERLFHALSETPAHFILSTWHHNEFRKNEMIDRFWKDFNIITQEHFYHSGARIENRRSIVEALVCNFDLNKL